MNERFNKVLERMRASIQRCSRHFAAPSTKEQVNGIEGVFNEMDKVFGNMERMMSRVPATYLYTETTYTTPSPYLAETCEKCSEQKLTKKHVQVDEQRDCLLITCSGCGFQKTTRTADGKGNFDLPTVNEAKNVKQRDPCD